jgi:oligoendopeptidase F
MGQDHLNIHDRNVNIFSGDGDSCIPFSEAKRMILEAYRSFLPEMADAAEKFFDNGWIDAPTDKHKRSGAFAHPGAAQLAHPMVMVNYQGKPGDVKTLAHELGHGVHQLWAAHKGDAIVHTPLTLAETASVFGEMLTFKSLIANASDDNEKRKLLFDKVNDMINTVMLQISFYDFEKRINRHYIEKGQPLSEEEMGNHWREALQDSYGSAIPLEEDYGYVFGYIPHLIHSPFYVYAYAFGDALVNALYGVYEEGNVPDFEEKYTRLLEAGGTLKPSDIEEMFGLDIRDPGFWDKGLSLIEEMIDELEQLCQPLLDRKAKPDVKDNPEPHI